MEKNKKSKNKKPLVVNPYFVLGLLDNNNALGGPLGNPNGNTNSPKTLNPNYKTQLDEYNQALNFNKNAGSNRGALLSADEINSLGISNTSPSGLKAKNIYKSNVGNNMHFIEYEKPEEYFITPAVTPQVSKQGVYRDPFTNQPLPIEEYGSPGQVDKQLAQGVDPNSIKLSNIKEQQDKQAVMENNKRLLQSMTEEQKAEARSLKLTAGEYLAKKNNNVVEQFAYGGNMLTTPEEERLGNALPKNEYSHVNVNGETGKGALSGALTGAATGATMGSVVPGWGTAVGAVVGAVAGGISGGIKKKKAAEAQQAMDQQIYEESANQGLYALGGPLDVDSIVGERHENGGVKMGGAETEGGEAKLGNYIFSDRLTPKNSKRTFAQVAKSIEFKYRERDNDGPALRSKEKELESLKAENDMVRKETQLKEQQLTNAIKADVFAYGGYFKQEGGNLIIDDSHNDIIKQLAKTKGISSSDYKTRLLALGGNLNDGNPPYDDNMLATQNQGNEFLPIEDYLQQSLTTSGNYTDPSQYEAYAPSEESDIERMYNLANRNRGLENSNALPTEEDLFSQINNDPTTKTNKFGNEEKALLMSSLPAIDNLIASGDNSKTTLQKFNPEMLDLDSQRQMIGREIAKARTVGRENIRSTSNSSGDYLSNMAAQNAALTDSSMDALSQSYLTEANSNTQIRNQAKAGNTEIANQEKILNEQNKDLRRSLQNQAIANVSTNAQMYLKDKKLTSENKKQNDNMVKLINSLGYNYKFEDDNGAMLLKFKEVLDKNKPQ